MASGYTAKIENGSGITFKEFAKDCARAFGAAFHQRDDPLSAGLTLPEIDLHHSIALVDANNEFSALANVSIRGWNRKAAKQNASSISSWKKSLEDQKEKIRRYDKMMSDVLAWNPPTPDHKRLKSFMIEQINDSCTDYDRQKRNPPRPTSGLKLKQLHVQMQKDSITYHEKEWEKSKLHFATRCAWITHLNESLK